MFEQIKDFVRENPGLVAGGAVVGLLMALNFSGDVSDINASRKPASEVKIEKRKKTEFRSLALPKIEKAKPFFQSAPAVVEKKKVEESKSAATAEADTNLGFGFGDRNGGGGARIDFNAAPPADDLNNSRDNSDDSPQLSFCEQNPSHSSCSTTAQSCEATNSCGTSTTGGVGGGGGGGVGGGSTTVTETTPIIPTCNSAIPSAGIYNKNPYVTLDCDDAQTIYYCFSKTTTCDPKSSPSTYSSAKLLSTLTPGSLDQGVFNLSFYSVSSTGDESNVVGPVAYTVDANALSIFTVGTNDRKRIQTMEAHEVIGLGSSDFGKAGHKIFALNLEDDDPNIAPYSCAGIIETEGYNSSANSVRSPAGLDETNVSGYDPLDIFDVPLKYSNNLLYGSADTPTPYNGNWLVFFMSYTDPANNTKYSCINTKVELVDFHYEQLMLNNGYRIPNGSVAPFSGATWNGPTFVGGVKTFGDFSTTTNPNIGIGQVSNETIEQDITNIIH